MKKKFNFPIIAIACLLALPLGTIAQFPATTYGWNLGNTLEPSCGEGCWAPAATQQLINSVAGQGFNCIRIPVAWDSHANRSYVIDPAWLARVAQVVTWSRAAGMTVVIDNHWDTGWFDGCGFRRFDSRLNNKFQSYWTQIANTFKSYDSGLLFCAANEPDVGSAANMAVLLQYYQTFVNTVRATGGNNTTRWLILPGPSTDIDKTDSWFNTLPSDPTPGRLVIDVHYYAPWQYCGLTADASWGKMFYFWGQAYHTSVPSLLVRNPDWGEEAYMLAELQKMQAKFTSKGIPVMVGEFGAIKRTGNPELTGVELTRHLASRTYFDKAVLTYCAQTGIKPFYWDEGFNGDNGFAVFDRVTATVTDPDSVRALTGGAAVPPP
jgi:endoglucanase